MPKFFCAAFFLPKLCLNFHLVNVQEFVTKPIGLMFRRESHFVEPFNQIITQRLPFIIKELDDEEYLLPEKCYNHLFPADADTDTEFIPLSLKLMY
jgi:hypothetical protein